MHFCDYTSKLTKYVKSKRNDNPNGSIGVAVLFCCVKLVLRNHGPPLVLRFREFEKREEQAMAKPYRLPDFKKIYPEVSEEVIAVLKTTERKMQYQEYDLKTEQTIIDKENQIVTVIQSREDSYERLLEASVQFTDQALGTEELVIQRLEVEQLHRAISCLSDDDRYLIYQLYFEERTERDLAKELQLSQKGINKRKNRILTLLRELMKNF